MKINKYLFVIYLLVSTFAISMLVIDYHNRQPKLTTKDCFQSGPVTLQVAGFDGLFYNIDVLMMGNKMNETQIYFRKFEKDMQDLELLHFQCEKFLGLNQEAE